MPRTRAGRRQLVRRFLALSGRAVLRFMPTNIELLAADGRVVKNVKRTKDATSTLGIARAE